MLKPSNPGPVQLLDDRIPEHDRVSGQQADGSALAEAEAETYAMPATQGQLRFWSLDQLNPGNPALNMPLMWQCSGVLEIPAMVEAFAQCARRHEILRTTFELTDGKLSQIIHPHMEIPIPLVDLTGLTGESQRVESDRLTREHAAFRFKLGSGPLLVLKLLKLSPQHHLLLVTMHHIICDGISNGILMRDMVRWYEALVQKTTPALPELPIQFADYAIWHEQWRAGDEPAASLEFWRKTLGNGFTPIQLKHDPDAAASLTPERANLTGDIETLLIPPDLAARAHAFCIRENVTLNMLLFSIFCALLSRITRAEGSHHRLALRQPHGRHRRAHLLVHEHPGFCAFGYRDDASFPRPAASGADVDAGRVREPDPAV